MNAKEMLLLYYKKSIHQIEWNPKELEDMTTQLMSAVLWRPFAIAKVAIYTLFLIPETPDRLHHLPLLCIDRKTKTIYINAVQKIFENGIPSLIKSIDEASDRVAAAEQTWEMIYLFLTETTLPISDDLLDDTDLAIHKYLVEHPANTPSKKSEALCLACLDTPIMKEFLAREEQQRNRYL